VIHFTPWGLRQCNHPRKEQPSTLGKGLPDDDPVDPFEVVQCGELDHELASFPAHVHLDPRVQPVLQEFLKIVHPWRPK